MNYFEFGRKDRYLCWAEIYIYQTDVSLLFEIYFIIILSQLSNLNRNIPFIQLFNLVWIWPHKNTPCNLVAMTVLFGSIGSTLLYCQYHNNHWLCWRRLWCSTRAQQLPPCRLFRLPLKVMWLVALLRLSEYFDGDNSKSESLVESAHNEGRCSSLHKDDDFGMTDDVDGQSSRVEDIGEDANPEVKSLSQE